MCVSFLSFDFYLFFVHLQMKIRGCWIISAAAAAAGTPRSQPSLHHKTLKNLLCFFSFFLHYFLIPAQDINSNVQLRRSVAVSRQ